MQQLARRDALSSAQVKLLQRLEFIEFRLFWTGRLNRSDLMEQFRISAPQASNDISEYQRRAPGNLDYDSNLKGYVRTPAFTPVIIDRSVDRHLTQVIGVAEGWLRLEDTWFNRPDGSGASHLPEVDVVSLKRRPTKPIVLLRVLDAVRTQSQVRIEYSSMTGSPATARTIAPHALGAAWGRWYVRAWSAEHDDFRDYALARIASASHPEPRKVDPAADFEWHQMIDLILVPNPELNEDKQRAQLIEHDMVDGQLRIPCRLSMVFYLMAEHKLDIAPGILQPEVQPLVLANLDEVRQAREVARKLAKQALERAARG